MILLINASLFGQPPLSKKLQKEKAEFEAQIEAEKKYDSLINKADKAFKENDYVLARMSFEEAKQYNSDNGQWLESKVNDLDILMAKNAAREVDSILVTLTPKEVSKIDDSSEKTRQVVMREEAPHRSKIITIEEDSSLTGLDTVQNPGKEKKLEEPKKERILKPASAPAGQTPKPSEEEHVERKVKEDFSKYDDGLTEETFILDNHEVLRIVVKEGMDVMVFKKVKHKWGGEFYFLDDVGTSSRYWIDQVEKFREKHGNDSNQ
ncbi:MAG: hypothetical protein WEC59_05290 [Salibacteraceae bacterium]